MHFKTSRKELEIQTIFYFRDRGIIGTGFPKQTTLYFRFELGNKLQHVVILWHPRKNKAHKIVGKQMKTK